MRGKTVVARFNGQKEARTAPLYQYDYGQVLVFADLELPAAYEVHFGDSVTAETITMVGGPDGCEIPNDVLIKPGRVYAWVYLHEGEDDGETEYTACIPVTARGEITDAEPTPEQQSALDAAIAALNAGVSEVEGIADAIPQTVAAALTEAKESGEFDGPPGEPGPAGADGQPGPAGRDGVSPAASVTQTDDGAVLTVTDGSGTTTATLANGADGQPGQDGQDGVSPTISASEITGGHRLTIVDAEGTTTVDVMDGTDGSDGSPGQDGSPGADGYSPTASVSKSGGTATITITDKTGTTTATVSDGVDGEDGNDGYSPTASVTKSGSTATISITDKNGTTTATVSDGTNGQDGQDGNDGADGVTYTPSVSAQGVISWSNDGGRQNPESVSIMGPQGPSGAAVEETVTGTTPSITAAANHRYVCGHVSTLSFTPSATGICDVVFESGSTATVLTVPNTVRWPDWFDPTSLEANATYELNILNGVYGAVGVWS